jgi:hypothetical protein
MSNPPGSRPHVLLLVAAIVLAGAVYGACEEDPAKKADPFLSPYENTRPGVGYVGIEVCASCHEDQYATYKQTPHSRAFRAVDPEAEPWPGVVHHETTGLVYEMHEKDGKLWVRESVPMASGEAPVLSDRPVDYVVGSGESSLTYLARDDGFLLESPATWYARKKGWGMSPGYDMPQHHGFSRVVSRQCLDCHVGRVQRVGGSDYKLEVGEGAIGCERCHGPGAAHVAFHRKRELAPGASDPTIVVPTDLDPALAEDVCAQCHLDDSMVVKRPGMDFGDWRPGLPAGRWRAHYGLKEPSGLMRVVGHQDQLKASRCYQASGVMTCLTCHDPHGRPAPAERPAHYRDRCLSCHEEKACALDAKRRLAKQPDDNCIACHMPTVGTDLAHFAFTHHRVGVHRNAAEDEAAVPDVVDLEAKDDVSHLTAAERERDLGMAYWQFRRRPTGNPKAPFLPLPAMFDTVRKARRHLAAAYAAGLRDPRLLVTLAEVHTLPPPPEPGKPGPMRAPDFPAALRYLDEAFEREAEMSYATLVVGLQLRTTVLMRTGRFEDVQPFVERLVALRREANDWATLAELHWMAGRKEEALKYAGRILELRSHDPMLVMRVAQYYEDTGEKEKAALHRRIAQRLIEASQQARAK